MYHILNAKLMKQVVFYKGIVAQITFGVFMK